MTSKSLLRQYLRNVVCVAFDILHLLRRLLSPHRLETILVEKIAWRIVDLLAVQCGDGALIAGAGCVYITKQPIYPASES